MKQVREQAQLAKLAKPALQKASTALKNQTLSDMANRLLASEAFLLEANAKDLENGRANGKSNALLDRLALNPSRIAGMSEGLRQIVDLPDPTGDVLSTIERPNGLRIEQVRVPIGVIGMIYEARPNVTVDAAGLCLKTGNAVVLRGGSAAMHTNLALIAVLHQSLEACGLPVDALQYVEDPDRKSVDELLTANGLIDVVIPRGGRSLIQHVVRHATIPAIETGEGICHTFLDASADPTMAEQIVLNAKVQRPSVCNSMETLLIHEQFATDHFATLANALVSAGVELRGDGRAVAMVPSIQEANESDWATEYLDLILSVRIVNDLDEALDHIRTYGTLHSECIVTENSDHATRFLNEVDAAAVYHNASTRFTDGFEFGFGAEIGISTQKLHARGPMGLPALTTVQYRVHGTGQVRG
jgi:glutamate-5-semialdehyde dehydrogenase